jgi:ribosomal protein L11 methyltransferase
MLLSVEPASRDDLLAELWELGTAGIIEEETALRAFFHEPVELATPSVSVIEVRAEPEYPFGRFDRADWDSLLVGDRWFIAPSWVSAPTPAGRIRLTIDCQTAFGTGRHESTQLVLCAMERQLPRGMTVLDVGCGSGILSKAALLLGAGTVISCDVDSGAVGAVAGQNPGSVFQGSAEAVGADFADIVLTNISAAAIDGIANELSRVVKPDGILILAGFIFGRPPRLFVPEHESQLGDWLCWVCRRPPTTPGGGAQVRAPLNKEWWD